MGRNARERAARSSSHVKGKLLEGIVAAMHSVPGVIVRTNVWVPAVNSPERKREIDVLIDGAVAGYPIRIPIECKNERGLVNPEQIDAFEGKLRDIGLSGSQGIYVAARGFTRGALGRAKQAGIRTLLLSGLSPDRLKSTLFDVVYSVVWTWPVVTNFLVENRSAQVKGEEIGCFYDTSGSLVGSLQDLAWRAWLEGDVSDQLGPHEVALRLPKEWNNIIDGASSTPNRISMKVKVVAIGLSQFGSGSRHALVDAQTGTIEKLRVKALVSSSAKPQRVILETEEDIQRLSSGDLAGIRVLARVRLPRIQWGSTLWPLTAAEAAVLTNRLAGLSDHDTDAIRSALASIPPLQRFWEPVALTPFLESVLKSSYE